MPRTKGATDWSRVSSALAAVLTTFLVLGLAAGLTLGLGPLEARAASVMGIKSPTVTIEWPTYQTPEGPVTWLGEGFQEQILERARAAIDPGDGPTSVFRRDPLMAVAEAMRTSGWFEGTPTVTRRAGGEIHVGGTWRIPAAVVRHDDKDLLVSWNAFPMQAEYPIAKLGDTRGQTVILGVGAPPPVDRSGLRDFTVPWPGEDLRAGLELLALLSKQSWSNQVVAIDVGEHRSTGQLVVVTRRLGRVVWGGRPGEPRFGEVSTAAKISHLDQLNRLFGSIDAKKDRIVISGDQPLEINATATGSLP